MNLGSTKGRVQTGAWSTSAARSIIGDGIVRDNKVQASTTVYERSDGLTAVYGSTGVCYGTGPGGMTGAIGGLYDDYPPQQTTEQYHRELQQQFYLAMRMDYPDTEPIKPKPPAKFYFTRWQAIDYGSEIICTAEKGCTLPATFYLVEHSEPSAGTSHKSTRQTPYCDFHFWADKKHTWSLGSVG